MRTPLKVAGFGVGLVAVFGAALGIGHLSGVSGTTAPASHGAAHGGAHSDMAMGVEPAGLAVAQEGYSLHVDQTTLPLGTASMLSFRIEGRDGVVTKYTKTHDRELHLIVVRRDLSSFQHVHPTRAADGTWSVPITLSAAGPYKVYADFAPDDRTDALVLATEVAVPGAYTPIPVGSDTTTATVGGDNVTLEGQLAASTPSALMLDVTRDGKAVALQPYLGAFGHLVVIRTGDLAYLHVHPEEGEGLHFLADVPTAGTYRAFLDYQHDDVVRTAAFTLTAH
jgi:hypothetical protein